MDTTEKQEELRVGALAVAIRAQQMMVEGTAPHQAELRAMREETLHGMLCAWGALTTGQPVPVPMEAVLRWLDTHSVLTRAYTPPL